MRTKLAAGLLLFVIALVAHAAPPPPELAAALQNFRTEGAKGWSYTQITTGDGEALVERYNPAEPEPLRWTLRSRNGQPPSPEELQQYRQSKVQRSSATNAPRLQEQLDLASCETLPPEGAQTRYRFRLKAGDASDRSAEHLRVTLTYHQPSHTIVSVEIASAAPFSPVFGIKIAESRSTMTYSVPEPGRPSLLLRATIRVRGRAYWLKSLDQDLTVEYRDYAFAGKS